MTKILILLILLVSGCTHNSEIKSDRQIKEEYFTDTGFCTGYIHGGIEKYWSQHNKYPPNLTHLTGIWFKKIYKTCIAIDHLKYNLINNQTYLLQYAGDDGQFKTDDDYYFYPNVQRGQEAGAPSRLEEFKSKGNQAYINYCSGFILGGIEEFWEVFGYYPNDINLLNHPYMDIIYQNCIPKENIVYTYHDPQHYTLQLPGYDEVLDTHDDFFFVPHYGKTPIRYEQRNKAQLNSG